MSLQPYDDDNGDNEDENGQNDDNIEQ